MKNSNFSLIVSKNFGFKWVVTYKDEDGKDTAEFDSEKEADDFIESCEARKSSGEKFELISKKIIQNFSGTKYEKVKKLLDKILFEARDNEEFPSYAYDDSTIDIIEDLSIPDRNKFLEELESMLDLLTYSNKIDIRKLRGINVDIATYLKYLIDHIRADELNFSRLR